MGWLTVAPSTFLFTNKQVLPAYIAMKWQNSYICDMGTKGTTSYRIGDQNALHYITIATVEWLDIFTRRKYKDIITDSLAYCRKEKGLELYGYVVMTNHVHLICRAKEGFELSDILRDFKRHTAKYIINEIQENPHESIHPTNHVVENSFIIQNFDA